MPTASTPRHGPCYPWEADHSPGDHVCAQGERGKALGLQALPHRPGLPASVFSHRRPSHLLFPPPRSSPDLRRLAQPHPPVLTHIHLFREVGRRRSSLNTLSKVLSPSYPFGIWFTPYIAPGNDLISVYHLSLQLESKLRKGKGRSVPFTAVSPAQSLGDTGEGEGVEGGRNSPLKFQTACRPPATPASHPHLSPIRSWAARSLAAPLSHLRGLRRPDGHGDGHLVLSVTGRDGSPSSLSPPALPPTPAPAHPLSRWTHLQDSLQA